VILVFTYEKCPSCEAKKAEFRKAGVEFLEYVVRDDGTVIIPEGGVQDDLYSAWAKAKQRDVPTDEFPWMYDTKTQTVTALSGDDSCKLTNPSCGATE